MLVLAIRLPLIAFLRISTILTSSYHRSLYFWQSEIPLLLLYWILGVGIQPLLPILCRCCVCSFHVLFVVMMLGSRLVQGIG
jgi:hypothetical protein